MSQLYDIPVWESGYNEIGGEQAFSDKNGIWPSKLGGMVDKTFFHPGRGHLYRVIGLVFQAEDDRWELLYRKVSHGGVLTGPVFSHRPEDFGREGRFLEVKR